MQPVRVASALAALTLAAACGPRGIAAIEIRPTPGERLPMDRKGKTEQFTAAGIDKNGMFVTLLKPTWTSSDPSVFSVDVSGVVTAVGSGRAELGASYAGFQVSTPIEVRIVGSVELIPPEDKTFKMGETFAYKAVVKSDRGAPMPEAKVTWEMNGFAADVDQSGEVRGQAIGESVLSVRSGPVEAKLKITVIDR